MTALYPFYLVLANDTGITKIEREILEAIFFVGICNQLGLFFKTRYSAYLQLIKSSLWEEVKMLDENFIRNIILDIVDSEEYTIEGIAYYTNVPKDALISMVTGCHTNPSMAFFRRILELHRTVRKELYQTIMAKVIKENVDVQYLAAEKSAEK